MIAIIDYQQAFEGDEGIASAIPSLPQIEQWANAVLECQGLGEHEITVFVEGIGPDQRAYKKAASLVVEKDTDIKAIEIRIQDQSSSYQADVAIVEWE